MKILCIQLARLGDILVGAPALHALKREHPGAEIDILVRKRFEDAAKVFPWLNVKTFDTAHLLEPLLNQADHAKSCGFLNDLVQKIKDEKYDLILNFTFSPFSSYLTAMVSESAEPHVSVRGYTRFADGSFAIQDLISGYFYSQVGIGKPNRLHLSDLLAGLAGVNLTIEDWKLFKKHPTADKIAIHVGASQANKALSVDKIVSILTALKERNLLGLTLIGSQAEQGVANQVMARVGGGINNLCGRTSVEELKNLIASCRAVIGADSAPMHFATLAGVPCLNISFPTVNFFETGPRSSGSRVLYFESSEQVQNQVVANEAEALVTGGPLRAAVAVSQSPLNPYLCPNWKVMEAEWSIVQNAYFRMPFQGSLTAQERQGITQFKQLSELVISQIQKLEAIPNDILAHDFISQADILVESIGRAVPSLRSIGRWITASRATVGPGKQSAVLQHYKNIYLDLSSILEELAPSKEVNHGNENLSS